jgi:Predicted eukaryotic-type DNA primase
MTTGSRGLHVTIPLEPVADHDTVREVSQDIAAELVRRDPKHLTTEIQKDDRGKKLFVDTLRNAYAHTAVAPYAARARDGAPGAAPVRWSMLDDPAFNARRFKLRDFAEWSKEADTAWEGFEASSVRIEGLSHRTSQS